MKQLDEKRPISPDTFQIWAHLAETSEAFAEEWRDYSRLMAAFQEALERAPRTTESCAGVDMERLFVTELEHLANLVSAIFPVGGMIEFESYVTAIPQRKSPTSK